MIIEHSFHSCLERKTLNKKKTIKKILFLALWLVILGGMTTLLVAANRKQKDHVCHEILVGIKGTGEKFYIEKQDILSMVEKASSGSLVNRAVTAIDLARLEKLLESHSWIRDAELYFDSRDALHISVEEREPIARIFATNGTSFYMDSSGHKMSLVETMVARVPVVTGFVDVKRMDGRDSAYLQRVKEVVQFIYASPFWNAQVGQIDITPEKNFELIPVVGDHVIRLGSGENIEQKLERLYVFYRQVVSKVGLNKYAALDLQFDGQVVAVKKEATSPVDSIQLQKNIQELMRRAALQDVDENMLPEEVNYTPARPDSTVSNQAVLNDHVPVKTNPNPAVSNPSRSNPPKTSNHPKSNEKPKQRPKSNPKKPKAVMRG